MLRHGSMYYSKQKVIEAATGKKIVWFVLESRLDWLKDKQEWRDTRIVWNIKEEKNSTKVEMTHVGLVPGIECCDYCEEGWNRYMGESLQRLIRTGKGLIFEAKQA